MKALCVTPDHGYQYVLTKGKEYDVLDIQDGTFPQDYYISVMGDTGRVVWCLLYRFNVTREAAEEYVVTHHADWRNKV